MTIKTKMVQCLTLQGWRPASISGTFAKTRIEAGAKYVPVRFL